MHDTTSDSTADTTPEAARVRLEAIRRLTPSERVAQSLAFSESMRTLALARLRARHPDRSDAQLVEMLHGQALPTGVADRTRSR